MQLKISNIGKIEEATIDIDGITVIAGENNAGKSTIGKLLFAIFNSMNNMDEKVKEEKRSKIYQTLQMVLQSYHGKKPDNYAAWVRRRNAFTANVANYIMEYINGDIRQSQGDMEKFLLEDIKASAIFENPEDLELFLNECVNRLKPILNVSDDRIMAEVITRWFNRVFEGQVSPLWDDGIESEIELTLRGEKISYLFRENACVKWESDIPVLHGAFYIDNPFIIDKVSDPYGESKITENHLIEFLRKEDEDIFDGIFDAVIAKDKLEDINAILGQVIAGDITVNQEGEYCFKAGKDARPLYLQNMSTGLKAFALLKMLLENGSIKEKDVLILDEPEIHLHPEWQLLYAQLIVLLQKEFDLSLIITTHSPYFLDAIDVYSTKYNTSHAAHYYLAENEGVVSHLRDVTNNIDAIYKKLSDPMQMLENLRYNAD